MLIKYLPLLTLLLNACAQSSLRAESIEYQLSALLPKIANKNIAMLTNPTSVDANMNPLFDRIIAVKSQYNITFKCFFAPEHGLRGDRQDGKGDDDYVDQETGIKVYSLYGSRKAPSPAQLEGVDILIYDIQDVGVRYYTYIWTLTYTIEVLSQLGKKLIIFDRPNPLGRKVQGCPLTFDAGLIGRLFPGQTSSIPLRYGLTIGELIKYLSLYLPSFAFEVIKMKSLYEITEEDWVMSSPNMPTLSTVHVYAGMALIEATSISEGRGTTKPFQLSGYPGINAKELAQYLKGKVDEKQVYLREAYTIPTFSKHQGEVCGGIQLMPKSISQTFYGYNSVETSLYVLKGYLELNQTITVSAGIDKLFGIIGFFSLIRNKPVDEILSECQSLSKVYKNEYKSYWLYDNNLRNE